MTEKQLKFFYFPAWNRCCMANDWAMKKGRWIDTARKSDPHAPEYAQLWILARTRAGLHHRSPILDDLRHACHTLALGLDKSAHDLSNKEVNRVVDLFEYLRDPENLDAVMRWQNKDLSERRTLITFIKRKAPEQYICKITRDKYGTIFWEDLEMPQLRSLSAILSQRQVQFQRPGPALTDAELEPANAPF